MCGLLGLLDKLFSLNGVLLTVLKEGLREKVPASVLLFDAANRQRVIECLYVCFYAFNQFLDQEIVP